MRAGTESVRIIRKLLPYLTAGVVLAACYTVYVMGSRWLDNRRIETARAEAARVKAQREIAQVYGMGSSRFSSSTSPPV